MVFVMFALALMQSEPRIVTVAQGSRSGIEQSREAIARTPEEWKTLWKAHGGAESLPAVDFSREMVAAVFPGTRPTGGYRVEITAARREGQSLVVEYMERRPGADAIVSQALTSPFHIVRLPRHDGPVIFRAIGPPAVR